MKIESRTDWLMDPCFYYCFVCGKPFDSPPQLDSDGRLRGKALVFDVVIDEDNFKEETEERICSKCWVSDLSKFSVNQD